MTIIIIITLLGDGNTFKLISEHLIILNFVKKKGKSDF